MIDQFNRHSETERCLQVNSCTEDKYIKVNIPHDGTLYIIDYMYMRNL